MNYSRRDRLAPLRICLATPQFAPYFNTGGVAWYNRWLAEGLARKGHVVRVIGVSIHDEPLVIENWGQSVSLRANTSMPMPSSVRAAIAVGSYLAAHREEFDIFETSNWPGYGAFRPRNMAISFIRLITSIDSGGAPSLRTSAMRMIETISVHRADATIASTSYIQTKLSKIYAVNLKQSYRVPFGLPDKHVPRTTSPDIRLHFLSIARADFRKGSDVLLRALLEAFEAHEGFVVTLIGSNFDRFFSNSVELHALWNTLLEKCSHRITILDDITEDRKLELLASVDYLLMTSRSESFGLPVIEAMRAGTAVISSTGGGLRDVTGASAANILYEDPENSKQLAKALIDAVNRGRADASQRGRTARETFLQHFHEDVFIDGTLEAYTDKLERSGFAADSRSRTIYAR